ncbi:hypothetical protein C7S15_7719 [Burkholderia cepacia]|nr:hypothetical protein [Burkholderia cepacia]
MAESTFVALRSTDIRFFDSNRARRHSIEIPFIRILMTLGTMNSRIAFE